LAGSTSRSAPAIRKLGARNRVEAVRIAEEKGWL
jgi:DNA-binding CsgD family transcriptional regulator